MEYRDWLDELMARTDLVKLISKYLPLTKKGASYWGCCPFHHEKLPSFCVNGDKQLFHCFGCKAGGNAITFFKKIESVDSAEAIRILAKEAGIEPPPMSKAVKTDDAALNQKREKLYALMRDAARHYHDNLKLPQSKKANEYLQARKLDEKMVRRFGLGYSVDSKSIVNYLTNLGYTSEEMRDAGITATSVDGIYDVFYGRLIFPIINNFGEVAAFGGRVLEHNADFAKYRNSSQTIIFDKSRTIYGVNLLKKAKQTANIEYVIMTEGYMDVIALHKAGFNTAVASMGTSLTYNQAKQLKNYCDKIYISYDGDGAGKKATLRGLDILADAGLNVKVVSLPDGMDPDDVIKQRGAEGYKALLGSAMTLSAFKIDVLKKQYDLSASDGKAGFAVEAIKFIKQLPNPVEQEEYLKIIQSVTGYSMPVLLKQAELTAQSEPTVAQEIPRQVAKSGDPKTTQALQFILASVLNNREYVDYSDDLFFLLTDSFSRQVYDYCITRFKADGGTGLAALYNEMDESLLPALEELVNYNFVEGDNAAKYADCVISLKISSLIKTKQLLAAEYESTKNSDLVKQILAIDKKMKEAKENQTDE